MWQMRGLALSRARVDNSSLPGAGVRTRQALKLTMEPRRGLVACNGRAGHVQVLLYCEPRLIWGGGGLGAPCSRGAMPKRAE